MIFGHNLVGVSITKYQNIITLHHEWLSQAAVTPH
jgi:BarA-like signal transduction histidine kinase